MSDFLFIHKKIFKTDHLTTTAKMLYMNLQEYAFDNITCYPTIEQLSKDIDMSERTVHRALLELKTLGLVKISKFPNSTKTIYVLIPVDWVKNLNSDEFEEVAEEEQQIHYNELDEYVAKIKEYYNSHDTAQVVNKTTEDGETTKKKSKTAYDTMLEKVNNGNLSDFNIPELIEWLRYNYEKHGYYALAVDYKTGRSMKVIKDLLNEFGYDYLVEFLKVAGENYHDLFGKTSKYKILGVNMLQWNFIKDTFKKMTDRVIEFNNSLNATLEVVNEVF